ncbi:CTP--2,3-di-O-geranylgeranyl-sn-glycero-1-phosphate cytidyltransferase [Candidatus Pacearchaeota archaeon]|nr:CTP--2,3-di-O-geranylgeranyl-sn-glycero-1-phosphate cytidyltransferase [Candidatus Pacearchaeota archaeon]
MKKEMKIELKRKAIHLSSVFAILFFLIIYFYLGKGLALLATTLVLLILMFNDYLRVEKNKPINFIKDIYRKKEESHYSAAVFLYLSFIICYSLFEVHIATAALLMIIVGDASAALFGKTLGKRFVMRNRTLEGIIAEFVINFIIAVLLLNNWWLILAMSLTATISETLTYKLEDNLVVPITTGFFGQVVQVIVRAI